MVFVRIALIIAAVYFLYCFIMFCVACLRRKPDPGTENPHSTWYAYRDMIHAGRDWFLSQPSEKVSITSRDGQKLYAAYLPCEGSKNTIILVHGYRSNRFIDFACAFQMYHELGLNILSIDMRSHGDSEGKYILFGLAERYDIVDWAGFLNEKYHPDKIIFDGISMGAATVLMTLDLELPSNVAGVIADCGYTSPKAIWSYVAKRDMYCIPQLIMPGVSLLVKLFTGYDPASSSAIEAVKKAKIPVLFVHGEADGFVPCYMSRENYEACASEKTLLTIPGAKHGCSFLVDREKCVRAIKDFLDLIGIRVLQGEERLDSND
ncbi:MAG: alpha/beta hydrolase [Clostridia bacterium]|nr:alpha/beta hydrolase [Clostridia bacterium]